MKGRLVTIEHRIDLSLEYQCHLDYQALENLYRQQQLAKQAFLHAVSALFYHNLSVKLPVFYGCLVDIGHFESHVTAKLL